MLSLHATLPASQPHFENYHGPPQRKERELPLCGILSLPSHDLLGITRLTSPSILFYRRGQVGLIRVPYSVSESVHLDAVTHAMRVAADQQDMLQVRSYVTQP